MTKYLVDANVILRYLLHDNPSQLKVVNNYLYQAKKGKLKIVVLSEIVPEVEYVLRKVYKVVRTEIADKLITLLKTSYLEVEKREDWIEALGYYKEYNIDLIDALLFIKAEKTNSTVLSFDNDFKKLKKYAR
jgi:predicted nucleic-acid-binding protein